MKFLSSFVLRLTACLALSAAVAGGATAQTAPVQPLSPVAPSGLRPTTSLAEGYILGPGDVIEVAVLGRDEFKPRVQVQTDGTIQLPYLHSIRAQDMSVLRLRDEIARLLRDGGFYTDPVVSLTVASYASRYVTVLGDFGTPGLTPVDRAYRVSEILARAGGAKATAGDNIVLTRSDGQQVTLPIAKVSSGSLDNDPYVQPGDKLYIPPAPSFYIYGQVSAPGAFKVERGMTIRMALARGGGLTDRGSAGRISLFRNGHKSKADLDMPITGDDTIVVGERFF